VHEFVLPRHRLAGVGDAVRVDARRAAQQQRARQVEVLRHQRGVIDPEDLLGPHARRPRVEAREVPHDLRHRHPAVHQVLPHHGRLVVVRPGVVAGHQNDRHLAPLVQVEGDVQAPRQVRRRLSAGCSAPKTIATGSYGTEAVLR